MRKALNQEEKHFLQEECQSDYMHQSHHLVTALLIDPCDTNFYQVLLEEKGELPMRKKIFTSFR